MWTLKEIWFEIKNLDVDFEGHLVKRELCFKEIGYDIFFSEK